MRPGNVPPLLPRRKWIVVRALNPGETDWEVLWLGVSVAAAACAAVWIGAGLPRPRCPFLALTGCPCPGCGATRALIQVAQGNLVAALHWNPLAAVGGGVAVGYNVYAAVVLACRLRRVRPVKLGPAELQGMRVGVLGAVLGNWGAVIWRFSD